MADKAKGEQTARAGVSPGMPVILMLSRIIKLMIKPVQALKTKERAVIPPFLFISQIFFRSVFLLQVHYHVHTFIQVAVKFIRKAKVFLMKIISDLFFLLSA